MWEEIFVRFGYNLVVVIDDLYKMLGLLLPRPEKETRAMHWNGAGGGMHENGRANFPTRVDKVLSSFADNGMGEVCRS